MIRHKNIRDIIWYKNNIVVVAKDGVWLYDSETPTLITDGDLSEHYKDESDIFTVKSSIDDKFTIYISRMMNIGNIDIENREVRSSFYKSTGYYGKEAILFSSDNSYLAASSESHFYIWDLEKKELIAMMDDLYLECYFESEKLFILTEEEFSNNKQKESILFYDPKLNVVKNRYTISTYNKFYITNIEVYKKIIIISLSNNRIILLNYKNLEIIKEVMLDYSPELKVNKDYIILWSPKENPSIYHLPSLKKLYDFQEKALDVKTSPNKKKIALIKRDYVKIFNIDELDIDKI